MLHKLYLFCSSHKNVPHTQQIQLNSLLPVLWHWVRWGLSGPSRWGSIAFFKCCFYLWHGYFIFLQPQWPSCRCPQHSRPIFLFKIEFTSFQCHHKFVWICTNLDCTWLQRFRTSILLFRWLKKFFPFCSSFITDKWNQICKASSSQGWGWYSCECKKSWNLDTCREKIPHRKCAISQSHLIIAFKVMPLSCEQRQSAVYQRQIQSQQQNEVD